MPRKQTGSRPRPERRTCNSSAGSGRWVAVLGSYGRMKLPAGHKITLLALQLSSSDATISSNVVEYHGIHLQVPDVYLFLDVLRPAHTCHWCGLSRHDHYEVSHRASWRSLICTISGRSTVLPQINPRKGNPVLRMPLPTLRRVPERCFMRLSMLNSTTSHALRHSSSASLQHV